MPGEETTVKFILDDNVKPGSIPSTQPTTGSHLPSIPGGESSSAEPADGLRSAIESLTAAINESRAGHTTQQKGGGPIVPGELEEEEAGKARATHDQENLLMLSMQHRANQRLMMQQHSQRASGVLSPMVGGAVTSMTGSPTAGGLATGASAGLMMRGGAGALSPVMIGLAGVATAGMVVKETFERIVDAGTEMADQVKRYSPAVAMAFARRRVEETHLQLGRADRLGPDLAHLTDVQTELHQAFEKLKTELLEKFLPEIIKVLDFSKDAMVSISENTDKVLYLISLIPGVDGAKKGWDLYWELLEQIKAMRALWDEGLPITLEAIKDTAKEIKKQGEEARKKAGDQDWEEWLKKVDPETLEGGFSGKGKGNQPPLISGRFQEG